MIRAVLTSLCLLSPLGAQAQDPTINVPASDPAMSRAFSEAAETLPVFLEHSGALSGGSGDGFSIKVEVPVDHSEMDDEIIWVSTFAVKPDGIAHGLLDNEPVAIKGKRIGDRIEFHRDSIRDWSFVGHDQKLYGHYTTRVLLDRMSPASAAQLQQFLAQDPVPTSWR